MKIKHWGYYIPNCNIKMLYWLLILLFKNNFRIVKRINVTVPAGCDLLSKLV
jgi:hypothetical protein